MHSLSEHVGSNPTGGNLDGQCFSLNQPSCTRAAGIYFVCLRAFAIIAGIQCRVQYNRWRPYRVECTGSLPTSEVKRRRARLVLGWGTAREDLRVLPAFCARNSSQQGDVRGCVRSGEFWVVDAPCPYVMQPCGVFFATIRCASCASDRAHSGL